MAPARHRLGCTAVDHHRTPHRSAAQRHARVLRGWAEPDRIGDERLGEGEPAWWLNLQAHPDAAVDLVDGRRLVRAHAAAGEDRSRLWAGLRERDPNLDGYAALRSTETSIDVFVPRSDR
ncbi:nitroreductase/quinone reductase family protein [Solwaraspora sp. WMMB335]|uniref:nitroreductase/quinone reductase family protein n=1 Tax=Solwaraspora sp. WMMB335 TaxID=3404118 RepID=UPI003B952587